VRGSAWRSTEAQPAGAPPGSVNAIAPIACSKHASGGLVIPEPRRSNSRNRSLGVIYLCFSAGSGVVSRSQNFA
jgi:hypothetical protein